MQETSRFNSTVMHIQVYKETFVVPDVSVAKYLLLVFYQEEQVTHNQ